MPISSVKSNRTVKSKKFAAAPQESSNSNTIPLENNRKFTKLQKERIIKRFKAEMESKESGFKDLIDFQKDEITMKFQNRLNKILRKFWDFKISNIIDLERELKDNKVTLSGILKELEKVHSEIDDMAGNKENKKVI